MPTAFKSAKAELRPALTDALEAWLDTLEADAAAEGTANGDYHAALYAATQVVRDEESDAGPPTIRLQQPTEATFQQSKSDLHSELTVTVRVTGKTAYKLAHLAGKLRERLSMTHDGSHRIDMSGFKVVLQSADMQDNPLSRPTETSSIHATMQRYRFLVRPA